MKWLLFAAAVLAAVAATVLGAVTDFVGGYTTTISCFNTLITNNLINNT